MWQNIISIASLLILANFASSFPQNVQWLQPANVVNLPFYGGAKGQVLQISKDSRGDILSQVIVPDKATLVDPSSQFNMINMQHFANNLYNIHSAAQKLIELQERTKKTGQFKKDDQNVYASNLSILGESAQNLAKIGVSEGHDLSQLFLSKKPYKDVGNRKQDFNDDEEDVGEEPSDTAETGTEPDGQDSVQITPPSDSASVAEAKPVGIAIAGEEGVASSKPVATAVVGPGGLAIARPVATAIAGVDPNKVGPIGLGNKIPLSARKAPERVETAQTQQVHYLQYPEYQYNQLASAYYPIHYAI